MRSLKENLLVQFSVASFLVIAVTGVVLGTIMANKIRSDAIADLVDEAISTSSGRLAEALTSADLETPMTGERYDAFHSFVQRSIVSERTPRVKVWSRDGTVVYSNDRLSVGETFPEKEGLVRALNGEDAANISVPEDADNAAERALGTLMEVYTPITLPGDDEPSGVLELYQYYAPTAARIDGMRLWVFGSLAIAFIALYATLVCIVWRGWRTMVSQRRRLESFNLRLDQQVRERTGELLTANQGLANEVATRKQAEDETVRYAEELKRSNAELEQFAYVASHDLQEPLRMVASYTQLLSRRYKGQLDSDADEFIAYAVDGATRMQELIKDMLAYARVNSKTVVLEPVDTGAALEQAIADLGRAINECGASVTRDSLPMVLGDRRQVGHLFQNLLGNAIKFRGQKPPRVHVSAVRRADGLLFSVQDNGIGVPPQDLERVFTVFQRLHSSAEYPGTGIGLAICQRIVDRHKGTIWMESVVGQGTTVHFTMLEEEGDTS